MQKILIVGGAGYIGSHTLKHLIDKGYDCVVLDNLGNGHREAVDARAGFEQADLLDREALKKVFDKYKFDIVIHFAAYIMMGESVVEPQKYYINNVIGTLNLLEAMLDHDVRKIVFSSTCGVYGDPQYMPMDENHPQLPLNPYSKTKQIVENIFRDYADAYGLKYIALRYFNAAGAAPDGSLGESHHPESHLIPLVLKAIKGERENVKILGNDYDTPDGTCLRDYIHVDDLAAAHRLAVEKIDEFQGFINLGTGVPTSVTDIISAAEKVTGRKCPVVIDKRRPGDATRLYADNKKAREILGWIPQYTNIEDIIRTAWNWELNRRF